VVVENGRPDYNRSANRVAADFTTLATTLDTLDTALH